MAEQKYTVWQRLGRVFGPNANLDQQTPVFKFDKKELLKTTNKQEYETEKLQSQQTMYIGQQWQKVESNCRRIDNTRPRRFNFKGVFRIKKD